MVRIIVILILAFALWWLLRRLFADKDEPPQQPAKEAREAKPEDMVVCSQCGVNLPRSDARVDGGRFFCVNNPHCRP